MYIFNRFVPALGWDRHTSNMCVIGYLPRYITPVGVRKYAIHPLLNNKTVFINYFKIIFDICVKQTASKNFTLAIVSFRPIHNKGKSSITPIDHVESRMNNSIINNL